MAEIVAHIVVAVVMAVVANCLWWSGWHYGRVRGRRDMLKRVSEMPASRPLTEAQRTRLQEVVGLALAHERAQKAGE